MREDGFTYEIWVANALKSVLHQALVETAAHGMTGDHHFYINFRTQDDGVKIPDFLRAQYPQEITIVMQHQFEDLNVDEEGFAVTLSFGGNPHRLYVPFDSVTSFSDPSVNFALQMQAHLLFDEDQETSQDLDPLPDGKTADLHELARAENAVEDGAEEEAEADPEGEGTETELEEKGSADVIALDAFRTKK
ncbi:MAG: ClpXP protease specificity-enhancing factor SspB [Proteobacteria bacterium]|nr:ClpXP protease specificity-enhancing factor SspB [Pseudomonadota bacterium]